MSGYKLRSVPECLLKCDGLDESVIKMAKEQEQFFDMNLVKELMGHINSTGEYIIVNRKTTFEGTKVVSTQWVEFWTADKCIAQGYDIENVVVEHR